MIEIFLLVFVAISLWALIGLVIYIMFKGEKTPYDNQMIGAIDDLKAIMHSPHKKGQLGESVVRMTLSQLPKEIVFEQFDHPKIQGRPDFAIKLGERYLIIDSKFSTVEEHKYLVKRGLAIAKYNTPQVTFPFILMWTPDPAYEKLTPVEFQELYNSKVIVCNTSGLASAISLVFQISRIMSFGEDIDLAETIEAIQSKTEINRQISLKLLDKAIKQTVNSLKNLNNLAAKINGEEI